MLIGSCCQRVKSPANCTLVAVGAVKEKVCFLPFPSPAIACFALSPLLTQAAELEVQGGALDVVIVARAGFLDLGGGLVQFRLA